MPCWLLLGRVSVLPFPVDGGWNVPLGLTEMHELVYLNHIMWTGEAGSFRQASGPHQNNPTLSVLLFSPHN